MVWEHMVQNTPTAKGVPVQTLTQSYKPFGKELANLEQYNWVKVVSFWRRKWQPTPLLMPGKFHGLQSMGSQRVRHKWATSLSFLCLFKKIFIYLFLAALGLHCYTRALSSCGEWGLTSSCGVWASHCSGFSCCGAWALGHVGIGNYCRGTQ